MNNIRVKDTSTERNNKEKIQWSKLISKYITVTWATMFLVKIMIETVNSSFYYFHRKYLNMFWKQNITIQYYFVFISMLFVDTKIVRFETILNVVDYVLQLTLYIVSILFVSSIDHSVCSMTENIMCLLCKVERRNTFTNRSLLGKVYRTKYHAYWTDIQFYCTPNNFEERVWFV